jgi:hypothetical protein
MQAGLGEKARITPLNIDYGQSRVVSVDAFLKKPDHWEFSVPFGLDIFGSSEKFVGGFRFRQLAQ